jgi:hypothetical protein
MLMIIFFFYKNLTNVELIKKINHNFTMNDGYTIIESYDSENNILVIGDKIENKNTILHGKIVTFDMKLEDILEKINNIEECKFVNKNSNYTLDTIFVSKITGGVYKSYIIY